MDRKETFQRSKVYLHKIGKEEDTLILGNEVNPTIPVPTKSMPFVFTFPKCNWAVAQICHGVSEDYEFYVAPLSDGIN